jgi:glycogen debranching enzyme
MGETCYIYACQISYSINALLRISCVDKELPMTEKISSNPYATEANFAAVLHEARFAGGIAASGQRAGFGGNLFTRDTCLTMRSTMDHYPSMTRELLSILPQMQGIERNDATNEFPDAMPHQTFREISGGRVLPSRQVENVEYWTDKWGVEMKRSKEYGKHFTIYNSSDAPLLYLITLGEFMSLPESHGVLNDKYLHIPTGEIRNVGEAGKRCLNAMLASTEASEEKGSGLYAVPNTNPKQTSPSGVMRDGFDSYYYPEGDKGKPVDFGFMAYIENQALYYEALRYAADVIFPNDPDAAEWRAKAEEHRTRTLEAFWNEDAQFFAAAVDVNGKQITLESTAAAELLNGPFLKTKDGPDYVASIMRWLNSPDVLTPIGPRMISRKFAPFEGEYYSYQGTGAVWTHVNGIIAKGQRDHWGLYSPSYDLGVRRTLGLMNRTQESVELAYVNRDTNEPVYNPYEAPVRPLGAITIAAAELGQEDQTWAAATGLREIWDWRGGIPVERPGSWQRKLAREVLDLAASIPPADAGLPAQPFFVDLKAGAKLKEERARALGLSA